MALTTEQQALRRKILARNIFRTDYEYYLDQMLQGNGFCMEQLEIWAEIFADEELKELERQAKEAAERRLQLLVENNS